MGYRGLIDKQNRAHDLRAQGWTLTEICDEVGCSKASASLWCRAVAVDESLYEARRRDRGAARAYGAGSRPPNKLQLRKQAEIEEGRRRGMERLADLDDGAFLAAGTALYAGEGSKTDGSVDFANTDPLMIRFFLAWLRRFFDIDERRLRFSLYLHQGLDLEAANRHWSEVTGIPVTHFRKPYRAVPDPSIRTAKHMFGCGTVHYGSTKVHREIAGLMEALLSSPLSFDAGQGRTI